MTVTWVIERDVFSEECFDEMVIHFKQKFIPYHIVRIIPFVHEIEGKVPQIEGPCVVYGSIGSQKLAKAHGWTPGVWTNDQFNETVLTEKLGGYALNYYGSRKVKFKNVLKEISLPVFFIKPDTDTKEFAGMVIEREEFDNWYQKMYTMGYLGKEDDIMELDVVVSPPRDIGCEWRLVIIEGKVSEYSIYRQYQKVMPQHYAPPEVIRFAERMAEKHSPADVFVMDVCETIGGFKVVEYNTFNSSGLYKCYIPKLIDDVNNFVEKKYTNA